jgi:hypothetical protein
MHRVRRKLAEDMPELANYFQSGGLVDAVLNLGLPAPIDIQVSGSQLRDTYRTAQVLRQQMLDVKGQDYTKVHAAITQEGNGCDQKCPAKG